MRTPSKAAKVLRDIYCHNKTYFYYLALWLAWLLSGTVFYAKVLDISWAQGFYMAVNVGYSIGWGDISEVGHLNSQWFSVFYVMVGASFVGTALGFFAQHIVHERENWYEVEVMKKAYEQAVKHHTKNYWMRFQLWVVYEFNKLKGIFVWCGFVFVGTSFAWSYNDWTFINSLYFAISSMSTGGLYSLPADSPNWYYGMTGLFAATGVPIMAVAMATLASLFISTGDVDETLKKIKEPVTQKEVNMLTEFEIANDDGIIDKAEFVILCMVRTGAASPDLIKLIIAHFEDLDLDKDGGLTMDEICQRLATRRSSVHVDKTLQAAVRRASLSLADVVTQVDGGMDDPADIGSERICKTSGNDMEAQKSTISPLGAVEKDINGMHGL